MPLYEFHCDRCDKDVPLTLTMSERESASQRCPDCRGPLQPLVTSFYSKTSKKS
jgi:putative FmdB family regulatory protein